MPTLALNIQMYGRKVVIVGGGHVAFRKLCVLLKAGASVTVVALEICPEIKALEDSVSLSVRIGIYEATDLDSVFMVIAATSDKKVNDQVRCEAQKRKILVNTVDNPAVGDFTFPAVLRRGDLDIAVSTGGRCPTFAIDVRDYVAEYIGSEFGVILEQIAAEREKLLTNGSHSTYNTKILQSLAGTLIAELNERKEPQP